MSVAASIFEFLTAERFLRLRHGFQGSLQLAELCTQSARPPLLRKDVEKGFLFGPQLPAGTRDLNGQQPAGGPQQAKEVADAGRTGKAEEPVAAGPGLR
jgi:hypothetical protein